MRLLTSHCFSARPPGISCEGVAPAPWEFEGLRPDTPFGEGGNESGC